MVWFPVERQSLSLDFANTTYQRNGVLTDGLTEARGAADWAAAVGVTGSAAATPALIELRDAIRSLLRAGVDGVHPPDPARKVVNEAARAAPAWPELNRDGATAESRRGADAATNLRAELASDVIALLTGPVRAQVRACPAPGCQGFFLQNHPRRGFCSPGCATRTRVARHYHRHRPGQQGGRR
jgi:predicted RNA-binding Zn ribbon-like protein